MEKPNSQSNLPPTILTIFGATGDLSADYLIPALFNLLKNGLLPKDFRLVAVGRKPFDSQGYLDFILKKSAHGHRIDLGLKKRLLKHLTYFQGDLAKPESFKGLAAVLKDRDEARAHTCYNRLFYFATSPQLFASLARVLKDKALLMACQNHARKIRVLVEKPFGFNLASARSLNRLLLKFFTEDQIYRIDHYQGHPDHQPDQKDQS
jgi:glucose-6-phosphate 1-dehydrogenase